jgi:uncharacterized membrane protein YuzA (DUF378 family)
MIPNPLKLLNPLNWIPIIRAVNGLICGLIVVALGAWLMFGEGGTNYGDIPYYVMGIGGINVLCSVFK